MSILEQLFSPPLLTSLAGLFILYLIFVIRKILEEANNHNNVFPDIEKLKQSLPLTLNANWKLSGIVNGVPVWQSKNSTAEAECGVIACQALIQATAQATILELTQPKVLSLVQPNVEEISIIPVIHRNHKNANSEIKNDIVAAYCNVSNIKTVYKLFLFIKNSCNLKRQWRSTKGTTAWLSLTPEYTLHARTFGNWQCYLATDIPNDVKEEPSSMSLFTIIISPKSNDSTTLNFLKENLTAQIISIREYMDFLCLKKILNDDITRAKKQPVFNPPKPLVMSPKAVSKQDVSEPNNASTPVNKPPEYKGKEELGRVETPAEVKGIRLSTPHLNNHTPNSNSNFDASVSKNFLRYKDTIDLAFKMLLDVYNADQTTPGWIYLGNKGDIEIYRMPGDASCPCDCFKGTIEVKVPISYALQYVTDLEYKKEWDDLFLEGSTVEEFDEVTKVSYMEFKPVWPTSARDFCSITATRHIKGNIYAMAAKAVSHELCPPVKGKQRAEVIVGGFVVEGITMDPPLCKLTYLSRGNLKGRIPSSLKNKVNEKQPLFAGIIRDKLEERFAYQDPPDEGDVKISAARKHGSILPEVQTQLDSAINLCDSDRGQQLAVSDKVSEHGDTANETPTPTKAAISSHPDLDLPSNAFHTPVDSSNSTSPVNSSPENSSPTTPEMKQRAPTDTVNNVKENNPIISNDNLRELTDAEVDAMLSTTSNQWETASESSISSVDQNLEASFGTSDEEMTPLAEQNLDLPRDHHGNLDFKTLANQTAANLLEEILLSSKIDTSQKPNPDQLNTPGLWTFQGVFRNVAVYRKIHRDCNIHSFLGKGLIEITPVKVWETIRNPSARFVYDNMLKSTKVVKEINEKIRIIHMHHETMACFVRQARDFVVLLGERIDNEKYVLSGVSVDVAECPIEKNCVRGKVLASGWIVEPVLYHGKLCSLVSYLSQIDFRGRLPIRIINHVAKRQPMSVAYLRKYLESAEKGR